MERKKYKEPELEIIPITEEDIITTSGDDDIIMDEEEFIIPKSK